MSYTLEDIVNALNRRQQQQQQQQRYYSYRPTPHYRIVPASLNPYQSVYAGNAAESEEDDEDDYEPRYPAYYGHPLRAAYQNRAAARQRDRQRANKSAQQASQPASGLDGLFQLLNHLSGQDVEMDIDQREEVPQVESSKVAQSTPQAEKKEEDTSQQAGSESPNTAASTESTKKEEEKKDQQSEKSAPASSNSMINPHPILKKTHSTAQFQEPKPKIELSQRNFRDPLIPYSPQTNIYESNTTYDIVLAIPGASIKNLDIDFHPSTNELVVKGRIQETLNSLGGNSPSSDSILKVDEIRTGSIERRVKFPNLPKIIDEHIKAKYVNGLLVITIPKNLESEKQKVKRKVTIEDVPDEELLLEEKGGLI